MTSVEAARPRGLPQLAKYQILEEIGRGGMATVYRALDTRLGREVAVKVIHPHLRESAEVAKRFHTEATAVAKLRHANIVEVYDVSEPNEAERYLVVELVRGTTLRRLLSEHGALPPEIAGAIAIELLDALAHAHASGVVHRDIKPENVLVELGPRLSGAGHEATRRVWVKLTDFGIAKLLDSHGVTSTGQVLGSPAHMAPEQIEGGEVDARSDIFGLGVLFYECVVGQLPFGGANPAQVLRRVLDGRYPPGHVERPSIGSRWSAIADRALAHAREARFPSAYAMREAVASELFRLGFMPSIAELEAWLDDPGRYFEEHRARIVARLCALGGEARRRRDVLLAASDYNRALANAPDDPGLLGIVARLHRTEARKRIVGWVGAGLAAAVALGGVAAIGRASARRVDSPSHSPEAAHPGPAPSAEGDQSGTLAPTPPAPPVIEAPARAPVVPPPARTAVAASLPEAQPQPIRRVAEAGAAALRTLTFDMTPPMGIMLTVDDEPARSASTGDTLVLDGGEHALVFSCPVCIPVQRSVAAGTKSETLLVNVPVKPGTLVIDGSVDETYQIIEHPELPVRAGANSVPLRSAFERITVKQMETGATVPVRLEAGQSIHASFPR
ncbi:MAG: serine/threonine protein kinase [Polyangiaceae bacterium]|nr:serine/threonine protein kinase [Polyangiaceae bacterium]